MFIATLIGVFVMSNGIVVASDTAISNETGRVLTRPKSCQTGPRTVATLQGELYFVHEPTGSTSKLYDLFRSVCAEFRGSAPRQVAEQAKELVTRLQADLARHLERVPPAEFVRTYDGVTVARITVAGFDDDEHPVVETWALGVLGSRATQWDAAIVRLSRLSFGACGLRLHGEERVVNALRDNLAAAAVKADFGSREQRLLAAKDGDCSVWSYRKIKSLFRASVRVTVEHGREFGVRDGSVGPPLDLVRIPRRGTISHERVD